MGFNDKRMRGLTVALAMALWIAGFGVLNAVNKIASRAEAAYAAAERVHEETRSEGWWPFD
jgi:hypothetical protein